VDETRSQPPKIKVVDRRKFSAEGEPLDAPESRVETAEPAAPPGDASKKVEMPTPEPAPAAPAAGGSGQPDARLLELVTMLASQAELLLVGTDEMPAQPAEAQRVIDYLGVLEERTAGNLSADEAKILSTVLYQLRTAFLQRT
jgi:hypothetical protein